MEAFYRRPGTIDDLVYNHVVVRNEYRVPDRLRSDAVIVDIGAHIGSFSYLALTRGAGKVYSFEPQLENFAQAQRNLAPFGPRVELRPVALWRSDVVAPQLHFWPSSDRANTGGGTLIWDTDGPMVDAAPFDDAVEAITRDGSRISLMKLDCEGAEFPILLTSKHLDRIERIVGEYHELKADLPRHVRVADVDQFAVEHLVACLERAGFVVSYEKQATGIYGDMGLFFAERPISG